MITWLASYPRSGNTFARLSLYHLFGINTFSVYDDPLLMELGADEVVGHKQLPGSLADLKSADEKYVVKTHDLPSDDNPAIYLVRDGRDAVVSFARYIHSFEQPNHKQSVVQKLLRRDSFQDTLKGLILSDARYGGWSTNVVSWMQRRNALTHILKFEELIADPSPRLEKALTEVGLTAGSGGTKVPPSFSELHTKWPQFFRKGVSGSWRSEMSDSLHKLFWERHGEAMELVGYCR